MEMYQQEHDFNQKVAFGGALVVPARSESEANALQDISDVHDYLAFEHRNTAPFICRRLIQRLVMSNPNRAYLRRVVKVFRDNEANPEQFQEVLKAILLDSSALYGLKFKQSSSPAGIRVVVRFPTDRTRLREPVLRYTAAIRQFSPYPDPSFCTDDNNNNVPYLTPGGTGRRWLVTSISSWITFRAASATTLPRLRSNPKLCLIFTCPTISRPATSSITLRRRVFPMGC